jgi:hypothetical protein
MHKYIKKDYKHGCKRVRNYRTMYTLYKTGGEKLLKNEENIPEKRSLLSVFLTVITCRVLLDIF